MTKSKKHSWMPLMPKSDASINDAAGYWVDAFLLGRMGDMFYCTLCFKVGHKIKSHSSGVRVHSSDYFLNKANEIRKKYGLPLLHSEQEQPNSSNVADNQEAIESKGE